jgi:hypothetical protein
MLQNDLNTIESSQIVEALSIDRLYSGTIAIIFELQKEKYRIIAFNEPGFGFDEE